MFTRNCTTSNCPNQVELTFDPNSQPKLYCHICVQYNYAKYTKSLDFFYQHIPNKPTYEPRVDLSIYKINCKNNITTNNFDCAHVLTGEYDLFTETPCEKIQVNNLIDFMKVQSIYVPVNIITDKLKMINTNFKSGLYTVITNSNCLCFVNTDNQFYLIIIQVIR